MCAAVDPWRDAAAAVLRSPAPWSSEGFARLYELAQAEGARALRSFRSLDAARRADLAAETITRALLAVASADAPRAYFRTAVRRAALSWLRAERLAPAEKEEAPRYVEGALDAEEARAVYGLDAKAALGAMGGRDRAVLLADADGEAREAIAATWGTSRANVDQIVSRARRAFACGHRAQTSGATATVAASR